MKVMVIDDSRAMRTLLGGMIREMGFEVLEAKHGKDALDQLQAGGAPDVALVDWNMPEMNGYEFVKAVRADTVFQPLKLMMVTTETDMSQVVKAIEAGADEYVMKPFTKEVLLDKLQLLGLVENNAQD
jgi:two-component system, chemotaxis family, chemotaxis protein CheY